MTQLALIETSDEIFLAEQAEAIRVLGKQTVANVIEIGARLTAAKLRAGHGNWLPWLNREFGWKQSTADRFMKVHDMSKLPNLGNLGDFDIPLSGIYLLAAPSTPEPVREAVLDLAANGEHLTHAQVKEMIAEARAEAQRDEGDKYEKRLGEAQAKYDSEVERLRTDLGSALSPEALQQAIDEALAPLQRKIKRFEDEREKRKQAAPTRKDEFGLRASAVTGSLRTLSTSLTITPKQMVAAAEFVSEATGRTVKQILSDDIAHAKNIASWLRKFLEEI